MVSGLIFEVEDTELPPNLIKMERLEREIKAKHSVTQQIESIGDQNYR